MPGFSVQTLRKNLSIPVFVGVVVDLFFFFFEGSHRHVLFFENLRDQSAAFKWKRAVPVVGGLVINAAKDQHQSTSFLSSPESHHSHETPPKLAAAIQ